MEQSSSIGDILRNAYEYLRTSRPDDAINLLQQNSGILGGQQFVHEYLGIAYWMKGDLAQAESNLKAELLINPQSSVAFYNLGLVYERKGQIQYAIDSFRTAILINPDYELAKQMLQKLQHSTEQPAEPPPEPDQSDTAGKKETVSSNHTFDVQPRALSWTGNASMTAPKTLEITASGAGASAWTVESCPWWLDAARQSNRLNLSLRNCGQLSGNVVISGNGIRQVIPVSSYVMPDVTCRWKGFWLGLASSVAVIISYVLFNFIFMSLRMYGAYSYTSVFYLKALALLPWMIWSAVWGMFIGGKKLAFASILISSMVSIPYIALSSIPGRTMMFSYIDYVLGIAVFLVWAWYLGGWWFALRSAGWGLGLAAAFIVPVVIIGYGLAMSYGSSLEFMIVIVFMLAFIPLLLYNAFLGRLLTPINKSSQVAGTQIEWLKPVFHDITSRIKWSRQIAIGSLAMLLIFGGIHISRSLNRNPRLTGAVPGSSSAQTNTLLGQGADVNRGDNQGMPLLHVAVRNSDYNLAHQLVLRGANPNAIDAQGRTALMYCAQIPASNSMVRMLLNHGADPRLRDRNGRTARDIALSCSNTSVINTLDQYPQRGNSRPAVSGYTPTVPRPVQQSGSG